MVQIDDIDLNIISDIYLFAGDIILIQYVDDTVISANILNLDLSLLMSWTLKWLSLFNVLKCVVLNISLKRKALTHPPLTLNGFELEQVSSHRHLGLIFNSSFNFNDHIEHLCQKAGKLINMMKYLKYILPREALEKIYISRVRIMIGYGNILYDNCPKYPSDRLESVQLDVARVCTVAVPQSNCRKTISEIG